MLDLKSSGTEKPVPVRVRLTVQQIQQTMTQIKEGHNKKGGKAVPPTAPKPKIVPPARKKQKKT